MNWSPIISRSESLGILRNELLKQAREKHREQLKTASAKQREELLKQLEHEVDAAIRRRSSKAEPGSLLH